MNAERVLVGSHHPDNAQVTRSIGTGEEMDIRYTISQQVMTRT